MLTLDTPYPTLVHNDYIIDPSIMDKLTADNKINTYWGQTVNEKRNVVYYSYEDDFNMYHRFIKETTSMFLDLHGFKHNKEKWYMDVIRYSLNNDVKGVESGLAWHCENDNYPEVITVLMYLHIDEGVHEGNLRYKDKNGNKLIINVRSGTTVIMDGNVQHKPQDPYGTGKRDLIIMSFMKE